MGVIEDVPEADGVPVVEQEADGVPESEMDADAVSETDDEDVPEMDAVAETDDVPEVLELPVADAGGVCERD